MWFVRRLHHDGREISFRYSEKAESVGQCRISASNAMRASWPGAGRGVRRERQGVDRAAPGDFSIDYVEGNCQALAELPHAALRGMVAVRLICYTPRYVFFSDESYLF